MERARDFISSKDFKNFDVSHWGVIGRLNYSHIFNDYSYAKIFIFLLIWPNKNILKLFFFSLTKQIQI